MKNEKQRINWHNIFGRVLKFRWTPLGLQVIPEYEVAKHPLRIDVVIIKTESTLPSKILAQLPDGVREYLNEHNLIDFKSIHESYGYPELEKTDRYASLYQEQEKIKREELTVFAVSAMTPKKLLTRIQDWVQIQGNGIYRIRLSFREVILLVPNEMDKKEANDVIELFASQRNQYFQAITRMAQNPIWSTLEGIFGFFSKRLGKELLMAGLTLEQLGTKEAIAYIQDATPQQFIEVIQHMKHKEEALQAFLNQIDDEELERFLSNRKKGKHPS